MRKVRKRPLETVVGEWRTEASFASSGFSSCDQMQQILPEGCRMHQMVGANSEMIGMDGDNGSG